VALVRGFVFIVLIDLVSPISCHTLWSVFSRFPLLSPFLPQQLLQMMFAVVHIRSFFQLSNAHDAQNSQTPESQKLRARLEQLTNAVKINSEKLDALERKEALEKSSSSVINLSQAVKATNPVNSRFASNRYDRMHIALQSPKTDTTDSLPTKKKASSESNGLPKSAPVLPKSLSMGYKNHPILTLTDEQLRHEYTVSDDMTI